MSKMSNDVYNSFKEMIQECNLHGDKQTMERIYREVMTSGYDDVRECMEMLDHYNTSWRIDF